jgi:uncharacterized protein
MNYREKIVDYIRANAKPPDKFSHQLRLYELARQLAGDEPFDDDILFAAAWMHDLGVFIGHRPEDPVALSKWDNVAYAIEKTPGILKDLGFPGDKIQAVLEAIRTHLPSSNPISFEAVLLRDADILEQLGAVSILRTVSKVGRDTRFTRFSDAVRVLDRNAKELPRLLKLASAKAAAASRISALEMFLDAARCEAMSHEL